MNNDPDPFGPHPASTKIMYNLSVSGDDVQTAVYSNTKIIKRLYSDNASQSSLTNTWNGTNDSGFAQAYGTYTAKVKSGMNVHFESVIDGTGIDFSEPMDCAVDDNGNVYIVNRTSGVIQKFAPNGVLMWKKKIKAPSPAPLGKLCYPWGIAVDSVNGYVYVSDMYNTITTNGRITKFYTSNGDYTGDYYNYGRKLAGMCISKNKTNIYVVDQRGLKISKIYPNGTVNNWSVIYTNNNNLNNPTDVAVDTNNNIYVCNANPSDTLYKYTQAEFQGNLVPGASMAVKDGYGITVATNSLYVSYQQNVNDHGVQQISFALAGMGNLVGTGSDDGEFNFPTGIAYNFINNKIYVSDMGNNRMQILVDPSAIAYDSKIVTDPLNLSTPLYCAVDKNGNVYIVNSGAHKITVVNNSGVYLGEFGSYGSANGQFDNPWGVAVDSDGYIYVSDYYNDIVQKFNPDYTYNSEFGFNKMQPKGIYCRNINGTDYIYVACGGSDAPSAQTAEIRRYGTDGSPQGSYDGGGELDKEPTDIAVDYRGYMYVTSHADQKFWKWDESGNNLNIWTNVKDVYGITVDDYGNFYITHPDDGNGGDDKIYKRTPSNTNLMTFGSAGTGNGEFDFPMNITIDPFGYIWVSDRDNNRIQKFSVSWEDEETDTVTLSDPTGPPELDTVVISGTNVVEDEGYYYLREGTSTSFQIVFNENMLTDGTADPVVKFITADSFEYTVTQTNYTNNVWMGIVDIPTGHDGVAVLSIKDAKDSGGTGISPNPDTSYTFTIDTVAPSSPTVDQPGSPTSLSPITVSGSSEPNITVHLFNYNQSTGGSLTSSQSNIDADASGNFSGNYMELLTVSPPKTNWICGMAIDKAGNKSPVSTPRKMVVYVDPSAGNGYITPSTNIVIGKKGTPWSFVYTVNSIMSNGTMTIEIPQGWAEPSTNQSDAGYSYLKNYTSMSMENNYFSVTNTGSQMLIKISFEKAIPGANLEIVYGHTNEIVVTSSAQIGVNTFIMRAENDDVDHDWYPNDTVVPYAPGEKLDITVLPAPLKVSHTSSIPGIVYRGQTEVLSLNLMITNPNTSATMEVQQINLTVQNSNDVGIIPSSALSEVEVRISSTPYLIDNTIENSGDTIALNLLGDGTPVTLTGGAKEQIDIYIDIANNATASNVVLSVADNAITVRETLNSTLVDVITNVGATYPLKTSIAVIQSNQTAVHLHTYHSNVMPLVVSAGEQNVTPFILLFYNTNANVNDIEVTGLELKVEDRDNNGLVPDTVITSVRIQKTNNGPDYLIDNTIESSGDIITLDLSANPIVIPKDGVNGVNINVNISSTASASNFQLNLAYATNVTARDKITLTEVTNYAHASDSFPNMRSGNADITKYFTIAHDNSATVDTYENFFINVHNTNGTVLSNYTGVITLSVTNSSSEIRWTNVSGNGTLTDFGGGDQRATYQFTITDKGLITLAVIDNTVESINIEITDGYISDHDTEGYLIFASAGDTTPPYFTDLLPTNNQADIATNVNIVYNVFDNTSVISQSIIMRISGTTALSNGQFLTGYTGIIYSSNTGWYVTVNPTGPLSDYTSYTCYSYAEDGSGNTNSTNWSFTTADTTAPTGVPLFFISSNTITSNNSLDFIWSQSSDTGSGVTNYRLFMTNYGASWGTNIIIPQTNTTLNNLQQGTNYWQVQAEDKAGNWSVWSSVWPFVIDREDPGAVNLIAPINNIWTNNTNIIFKWQTGTDILSGVTNYRLQLSTNRFFSIYSNVIIPGWDNTNYKINGLSERTNYWRVQAQDKVGNRGDWKSTNVFMIDATVPVVTLTSPPSNSTSGVLGVTFNWTTSDTFSGISNQRIEIDTNNNTADGFEISMFSNGSASYTFTHNGTNNWRVLARDRAGNTNFSVIWNVIINTNVPVATLHSPLQVQTNINNPEFVWTREQANGATSNIIQIGTNNVFTTITRSSAGDESFTNWTVTPGLDTDQYYWRVLTYKQSTTTWYTSAVSWVWVDTNQPGPVNLYLPAGNSIITNGSGGFNMLWSQGTDVGLGITNYRLMMTNTTTSWSTNLVQTGTNITIPHNIEGDYSWYVINYDKVGNLKESGTNSFTLDHTPPAQVTLITPTNNSVTNNDDITFLWQSSTDTISGISNYQLYITNQTASWVTNILLTATNQLINNLNSGTLYWRVRSQDLAGLWGGYSATNRLDIVIDTTEPYFTNLSPTNNQVNVATNANITFNVFDNTSVISQSIIMRISGTTTLSNGQFLTGYTGSIESSNTGWYVTVNPSAPLAEWTIYNIYSYGEDSSGNPGSTNWSFRTADYTDPSGVSLVAPPDSQTTNSTAITFIWTRAFDTGSGITNYLLHITNYNSTWGTNLLVVQTNILVSSLQNGTNYWSVQAQDRVGNWGDPSSTNLFIIDSSRPYINNVWPVDGTTNINIQTNVYITFNETMQENSSNSFTLKSSAGTVSGSFTWLSNTFVNDTLVFNPDLFLSYNTFYTVVFNTNALDLTGNNLLKATNFIFKTARETNKIRVLEFTPINGSTDVADDVSIRIRFSGSMSNVTTSAFNIIPSVTGSFSWQTVSYPNDTLIFTPSSYLSYLTSYTCTITTNALSIYGNKLVAESNVIFKTGPDSRAPDNVLYLKATSDVDSILLQWQNPSDTDFAGTVIYYRTDGRYPETPGDGTLLCDRMASAGSLDSYTHENVEIGQFYYYTAFTYDTWTNKNYSTPNDDARAKATIGKEINIMDIRPNVMDISEDEYIEIMVQLPQAQSMSIEIYNIAGEKIKTIKPGVLQEYRYKWYGALGRNEGNTEPKAAPGAYFVVFQSNGIKKIKVFYVKK